MPPRSTQYDPSLPIREACTKCQGEKKIPNNPLHLRVPAVAEFPDGSRIDMHVLVDTGAQIDIVRSGLVPAGMLRPSQNPMTFITANATVLGGSAGC